MKMVAGNGIGMILLKFIPHSFICCLNFKNKLWFSTSTLAQCAGGSGLLVNASAGLGCQHHCQVARMIMQIYQI